MSRRSISLGTIVSQTGAGSTLLTSYAGGTSLPLGGSEQFDVEFVGVLAGGSTITSLVARLCVSVDGTNFMPVPSILGSSGVDEVEHTFAVAAGTTTRDWFLCTNHANAPFCRIEVKSVGAAVSGDSVTCKGFYLEGSA